MIHLDEKVESVLEAYHQRIAYEDSLMKSLPFAEGMKRRDEFLLSVGVETGIFLNTFIKSAKPQTIIEVGTSYGYSTVWLAEAAKTYGGQLITLEISAEKAEYAQTQIAQAGLSDVVTFEIGDALHLINQMTAGIDFVLLDIWKELYTPCFDLLYPKLNKGAWIFADNMLFPPSSRPEAEAYRKRVKETNAFDSVLLPIGSGIEMSFLRPS